MKEITVTSSWTIKTSQWVKMLVFKPDNLSSMPESHASCPLTFMCTSEDDFGLLILPLLPPKCWSIRILG